MTTKIIFNETMEIAHFAKVNSLDVKNWKQAADKIGVTVGKSGARWAIVMDKRSNPQNYIEQFADEPKKEEMEIKETEIEAEIELKPKSKKAKKEVELEEIEITEIVEVKEAKKVEIKTEATDLEKAFENLIKPLLKHADLDEDKVIELINKHAKVQTITKYVDKIKGTEIEITRKHKQFDELLLMLQSKETVWLNGGAGGGKSHATSDIAKVLGLNFYAKSICASTQPFDFFGYMDANGNFVETDFYKAFTQGGVFCLDEIDKGSGNILAVLNTALANKVCSFANGFQRSHEDFIIISTANTIGRGANIKSVGSLVVDGATLDRFSVMNWEYDNELEKEICGNSKVAEKVQKIRETLTAKNLQAIVSPRASIGIANMIANGISEQKAFEYRIYNKLTENERSAINV